MQDAFYVQGIVVGFEGLSNEWDTGSALMTLLHTGDAASQGRRSQMCAKGVESHGDTLCPKEARWGCPCFLLGK